MGKISGRGEWIRTTDLLVPNHRPTWNQTLSGIVPYCSRLRRTAKGSNTYRPFRAIRAQRRATERSTGWAQIWSQWSNLFIGNRDKQTETKVATPSETDRAFHRTN